MAFKMKPPAPMGLAGEQYERADSPMEMAQDKRQAKKAKMPVSKFEETPGDMEKAPRGKKGKPF